MRAMQLAKTMFLAGLLASLACSSGSSGGSQTLAGCWTHYASTCNAGFFIVIEDDPLDGIQEFLITVTEIELVSGEDSFAFFSGARRVDLLAFAERGFLLATRDDVPVARFDRVRMHVADLQIVPTPVGGQPLLPDNGMIDIQLEQPIVTEADALQGLRLDFVVAQSLLFDVDGALQVDPLVLPTPEDGDVEVTALRARVLSTSDDGAVEVALAAGQGRRNLCLTSSADEIRSGDWIEIEGVLRGDRTIVAERWVHVDPDSPALRPASLLRSSD
ncbi:MAG: DUF4382 domain-containing protein [Planctomycetota bacterium]